jgi:hypothetical protein
VVVDVGGDAVVAAPAEALLDDFELPPQPAIATGSTERNNSARFKAPSPSRRLERCE